MATPESAKRIEGLLKALLHASGGGGIEVELVPGRGLSIVNRRKSPARNTSSAAAAEYWLGIIDPTDANGDPLTDYTDHRYWVKQAQIANTAGGDTTPITLEAVDGAAPVTATNLLELLTPWHILPTGTGVLVFEGPDQQATPVTRRYILAFALPQGSGQYKVLQLNGSGVPHWDWVRAH